MLHILRLLLPTLIPSWRFFAEIGPSARIEYRLGDSDQWRDALPRQPQVSAPDMLRRLIWNPDWNEYLYLTTCAERIVLEASDHAIGEINARLVRRLGLSDTSLQFRLVFVSEDGAGLSRSVEYESQPVNVV